MPPRNAKELLMNRHLSLPFLLVLLLAMPTVTRAQTSLWSGIIDPSRAVNWSNAGVVGGIPNPTKIYATIAPEGTSGSPVAPTDINNALLNCPAGDVVLLEAGNFYLSGQIGFGIIGLPDQCTLRGMGANQTFLFLTQPEAQFIALRGYGAYPDGES